MYVKLRYHKIWRIAHVRAFLCQCLLIFKVAAVKGVYLIGVVIYQILQYGIAYVMPPYKPLMYNPVYNPFSAAKAK